LKEKARGIARQITDLYSLVKGDKAFMSFVGKRLVYLTGVSISAPVFPLYFVRKIEASDAWIGIINTAFTAMLVIGYFVWTRQSRRYGSRRVLVLTTLGMSLYPAIVSGLDQPWMIAIFAGMAGIFQGGLDLVFFDELMKTVPLELSATFVSAAQSLQYLSAVISPLIGSWLADSIGLSGALLVSAAVRFMGFILFYLHKPVQS
jgi:MFS family permease